MSGRSSGFPALIMIAILIGLFAGASLYLSRFEEIRFVSRLEPGWNLGNTLDAYGLGKEAGSPEWYETYWGNPATTKEMIDEIKKAGFSTIRIPVTWYEHMNEKYEVDPAWMDRVQQVIDYGMENDLFVILNAHHDDWYMPEASNLKTAEVITECLWRQIAERFSGYGEKLLFEGMNEPRLIGTEHEWDAGTPASREIVNLLNETFVKTVRSVPGHNADRYLLLPTYCASTLPAALADFRMPKGERLIVSIHLYRPYTFALEEKGSAVWSPEETQTREIDQVFRDVKRLFTRRGTPVIISEFGAVDKSNESARARWVRYIRMLAAEQRIPCVWWDDSVFDRRSLTWSCPELVNALVVKL